MPSLRILPLVVLGLAIAAPAADAPLPAGVAVVWDMAKAWHEITPTRARICLNGLWRWQPAAAADAQVPADDWGFFKVPGAWPGNNAYDRKEAQVAIVHPAWKNRNLPAVTRAWYQREFSVPEEWAGRRIALSTAYINSLATVFVDGKKIGKLRFPAGELDVTSSATPGPVHVLSILVEALPMKETMLAFNDTNMPQEVTATVNYRGLCGDVFLVSTPARARLTDVKIDPSVRRWSLTLHADLASLTPGARYALRATISDHGRPVKTLRSPTFSDADLSDGRYTFTQPWKPEKLWDLNTPQNQYDLALSLVDGADAPVDVYAPVRFGFRELWIDGRDFILNGTRLFWSAIPINSGTGGVGMATYAAAREAMERLQRVGINLVYTHNYDCKPGTHLSFEEILRAADDTGMLVSFSVPHFHDYDWRAADAAKTNGCAADTAFYVRVAQNHPSVVAYSTSHNGTGYFDVMNPDRIDGIYEPTDDGYRRNAKNALAVQEITQRLDPTRIVYHHSSGNLGMMWTSNFYLNFVPAQERSDWFEHWATTGVKPAFLCEYGMPYFMNWTMYRGYYDGKLPWMGHNGKVPYELCVAEWNAQWLGDRAFELSEQEKTDLRWEAPKFKAGETWQHWEYPVYCAPPVFDGIQEVVARYTTDNWRAFRTWGVSGISPWTFDQYWKLRDGVKKENEVLATDWQAIQRPGYSPDFIERRADPLAVEYDYAPTDWVPTVAGRAVLRNNQPLLAYLGGKPGAFTEKGHDFQAGETVEKQIVVVNNSRVAVSCACTWELDLPARQRGSVACTVATGEIAMKPISLRLPDGTKPGAYTLHLSVACTPGGTQEDSLTLHVLAAAPAPKLTGRIAAFDPIGETSGLLRALGVAADAVAADADLSTYDLLIIGKHALTIDGAAPSLDRVRDGLRVIVFEQSADVCERRLGFRVQEYGLREVFRRIPDHPALAGLDEDVLKDWRGEATNTSPRLSYEVRPYPLIFPTIVNAGVVVTRPWRCGNRGDVASALIEKPACGDFTPLIDGGYSLQYTPLMEYREGRGVVLFCQVDVTGRTERDPAAERLAQDILAYADGWKPTASRSLVYAGDPAGLEHLRHAGFSVEPYAKGSLGGDRVLVVAPGGGATLAPDRAAIAAWLHRDGRIVALGLGADEANAFMPVEVVTKRAEHIGSFFERPRWQSPFAGIGPADVHAREPRDYPLIGGRADIVGDGVIASAEDGRVVFCQLLPWQFSTKQQNTRRTFRRTSFLLTRLLGNLGIRGKTPLLERFSKPVRIVDGQPSEKRWSDGFYLDAVEEWDDPYRFFGW